jgi:hypothetical protein
MRFSLHRHGRQKRPEITRQRHPEGTGQPVESKGKSHQNSQTSPPASFDRLIDSGIQNQHAQDTDRLWENIRKGGLWLNEFHRQHSEKLREHLMKQPKTSLAEALEQYERIKRGSRRHKP